MRIAVTGAAGFIGHHLCRRLKADGHFVIGIDRSIGASFMRKDDVDDMVLMDLRYFEPETVFRGCDEVYALAADMGGMGFITGRDATCLYNNLSIDLRTIDAACRAGVKRLLYPSSACVYPEFLQERPDNVDLTEPLAYPAQPQDGYGWEKLIGERLCLAYAKEHGLQTRIVRFHSIYGPEGTWRGGREKVPAALCRKVALAKLTGSSTIEIWGDGQATRSFCYVDDAVEGIIRLMASTYGGPVNIGSNQLISITAFANLIASIAGVALTHEHVPGPQGVRGRNADLTLAQAVLGWRPTTSLAVGIAQTYRWVESQVREHSSAAILGL